MDPTTSVAIITGAAILKGPTQEFLRRISGPAADELGAWWRDSIHAFRERNTARTAARAEAILMEAQQSANEIPLRTLLPILEGASLEDDLELGEFWAALLANAARRDQPAVPPMFPSILGQLAPFDARLLSELAGFTKRGFPEDAVEPPGLKPPKRWGARQNDLLSVLPDASTEQLEVGLNTLSALGLIDLEPVFRTSEDDSTTMFFAASGEFRVSALGRAFLRACTAPMKPAASSDENGGV